MRSTECGVRSAEYGVRSTECEVRSAEYGVRSAESVSVKVFLSIWRRFLNRLRLFHFMGA